MYKCNKSQTHQSIKIEKDTENIKLRKRTKNIITEKNLTTAKKETVWDRLSKVKKVSDGNNVLGVVRSRSNLTAKSRRCQPVNQTLFKQSQFVQPSRKPLTPTSASLDKRSNLLQSACVKKQNNEPGFNKTRVSHDFLFKEILTARSSSEDSKSASNGGGAITLPTECSSEDSNEEYILAPLLTAYSYSESSTTRMSNTEILRDKRKFTAYKDIELLKDDFKANLPNIYIHGFTVSEVSSAKLQPNFEIESTAPINKIARNSDQRKLNQKLELDVIFKNVPSLNKEIEILKALGEKLETALKRATSYIISRDRLSQISVIPAAKQFLKTGITQKCKYDICDLTVESRAEVSVLLTGIRHCMGVVKEFRMAHKSIVELKRESSRVFYIPSKSEGLHLIRTSFKKLKETPNELLRHVKPKNSQVAFNVLEQDPVFFHSAFHNLPNTTNILSTNHDKFEEHERTLKSTILEPSIRGKQRRRIRRHMTPMPLSNYDCPKNSLFKTILVGLVQISVFVVFIMALAYPQVRC